MLGTTLWFIVAIALLAGLALDGAATLARAGLHAAADHAAASALHDALAAYQQQLASGATPAAGGTFATPGTPSFSVAYDVTPTTLAAPSCAGGGASGGDAIAWLQCHDAVRESRVSLRVHVRVYDAAQRDLYAERDARVTLRLFAQYPFSAVTGSADDAAARAAHEGDIGGDTVSGTAPPPATAAHPQGGTLLHVRYRCVPGPQYDCSQAAPPDPDDLRAGVTWQNGN